MNTSRNTLTKLAVVLAVQAAAVGVAVAPQLSARVAGDTYQLRVAPLDPIDPFRGAYVTLDYPDLQLQPPRNRTERLGRDDEAASGDVFVTLVEQGGVLVAEDYTSDRPDGDALYLACHSDYRRLECGIESLFLPQDEAAAMEEELSDGAIATVKIDGRGHAALMGVEGD